MEISYKNGFHYLSGRMDEGTTFDSILNAEDPLRLNFGKIQLINSVGIRKFLSFMMDCSQKKIEFHECTPDFMANLSLIPQMTGSEQKEASVVSFYVPYNCESCQEIHKFLFTVDNIQLDSEKEIVIPDKTCPTCNKPMDLDVEKKVYFEFLVA